MNVKLNCVETFERNIWLTPLSVNTPIKRCFHSPLSLLNQNLCLLHFPEYLRRESSLQAAISSGNLDSGCQQNSKYDHSATSPRRDHQEMVSWRLRAGIQEPSCMGQIPASFYTFMTRFIHYTHYQLHSLIPYQLHSLLSFRTLFLCLNFLVCVLRILQCPLS